MSDLRTRLIRLAHTNPELRPHVLPLVAAKTAAETYSVREATRIYDVFAKVRGVILARMPR